MSGQSKQPALVSRSLPAPVGREVQRWAFAWSEDGDTELIRHESGGWVRWVDHVTALESAMSRSSARGCVPRAVIVAVEADIARARSCLALALQYGRGGYTAMLEREIATMTEWVAAANAAANMTGVGRPASGRTTPPDGSAGGQHNG